MGSYAIRFDSRETAAGNAAYFTVKASYDGGFAIIVSRVTKAEWELYTHIIGLLRQKKISIEINRW